MWTLGVGHPAHLGDSEKQERLLIAGELSGNLSLTVIGMVVGSMYLGWSGGFIAAYALGALGDFIGCQATYWVFTYRGRREGSTRPGDDGEQDAPSDENPTGSRT
jgi:hypothetical protein